MQVRRCIVEQPTQRLEGVGVVEVMHIIDHQHQVIAMLGDTLEQDDEPVFERQLAATLAE
ncbi:hypothetical protein D9M68_661050 [compost metagenome]